MRITFENYEPHWLQSARSYVFLEEAQALGMTFYV